MQHASPNREGPDLSAALPLLQARFPDGISTGEAIRTQHASALTWHPPAAPRCGGLRRIGLFNPGNIFPGGVLPDKIFAPR